MAGSIPLNQIVMVNGSVVAAGGSALDLNGLLLTSSPRIPIGTVQSFPSQASVAAYFGAASPQAALATIYFLGFTNSNKKPGALLMAQYPWLAPVNAYLRGGSVSALSLTALQALSGSFSVTINGTVETDASISLSAATSFSIAASIIQAGLGITGPSGAVVTGSIAGTTLTVSAVTSGALFVGQTLTGTGITGSPTITSFGSGTGGTGTYTISTAETVSSESITAVNPAVFFDSVSGAFVINSSTTGATSTITYASGTLATALNMTQATGAVISPGSAIATPLTFMAGLIGITQNWATFTTDFEPVTSDCVLFAEWTNSQNNRFEYMMWDTDILATESGQTTTAGALILAAGYSGVDLIYSPVNLAGMAVFRMGSWASLDFTQLNGRATAAFRQQAGLVPDVTNGLISAQLILNGYNFYGTFSQGNNSFTFYCNGSVTGEYEWADSYICQVWMNNEFLIYLVQMLIAVYSIPYNQAGYSLMEAWLTTPITAAVNFGAIRQGVTLSANEIADVNNAAGTAIDSVLSTQGWYLQILDAPAGTRATRSSPPATFWYTDGGSVQQINLSSVEIQ